MSLALTHLHLQLEIKLFTTLLTKMPYAVQPTTLVHSPPQVTELTVRRSTSMSCTTECQLNQNPPQCLGLKLVRLPMLYQRSVSLNTIFHMISMEPLQKSSSPNGSSKMLIAKQPMETSLSML